MKKKIVGTDQPKIGISGESVPTTLHRHKLP